MSRRTTRRSPPKKAEDESPDVQEHTQLDEGLEASSLSPPPPSSTSVEGIPFVEEEQERTISAAEAKQRSQKGAQVSSGHHDALRKMKAQALAARKADRENIGRGAHRFTPEVQQLTPEEEAKIAPKKYLVEERKEVRAGGRKFVLYQGKEISENEYDIAHLKSIGTKLTRITPN